MWGSARRAFDCWTGRGEPAASQHQTLGWGANTGTLHSVVIWFGVLGLLINNIITYLHWRIHYNTISRVSARTGDQKTLQLLFSIVQKNDRQKAQLDLTNICMC